MVRLNYQALYRWTMTIAVLFSGMIGLRLFGVSLNKLALIPFFCVLFFESIQNYKGNAKQRIGN